MRDNDKNRRPPSPQGNKGGTDTCVIMGAKTRGRNKCVPGIGYILNGDDITCSLVPNCVPFKSTVGCYSREQRGTSKIDTSKEKKVSSKLNAGSISPAWSSHPTCIFLNHLNIVLPVKYPRDTLETPAASTFFGSQALTIDNVWYFFMLGTLVLMEELYPPKQTQKLLSQALNFHADSHRDVHRNLQNILTTRFFITTLAQKPATILPGTTGVYCNRGTKHFWARIFPENTGLPSPLSSAYHQCHSCFCDTFRFFA